MICQKEVNFPPPVMGCTENVRVAVAAKHFNRLDVPALRKAQLAREMIASQLKTNEIKG